MTQELTLVKKGETYPRHCKVIDLEKKLVELSNVTLHNGQHYGYKITLDLSKQSDATILENAAGAMLIRLRAWTLKKLTVEKLKELIKSPVNVEAYRPEGKTVNQVTKATNSWDKMSRTERVAFCMGVMRMEQKEAEKYADANAPK
jgi:hypothetical protein